MAFTLKFFKREVNLLEFCRSVCEITMATDRYWAAHDIRHYLKL